MAKAINLVKCEFETSNKVEETKNVAKKCDIEMPRKVKETMFEIISKDITCNFCQEIIWNSPIFEATEGITACETCKGLSQENFIRNFKTEKVLHAFEINCKYEDEGCEIIRGPHNIISHEEICQFRLVACPDDNIIWCKDKRFQFRKILEHMNSTHGVIFKKINSSSLSGYYRLQVFLSDFLHLTSHFVANSAFSMENDTNFIVQRYIDGDKESALLWVRLIGSKFEASDFTYKIEINGPGQFSYKGPVRYIDEKCEDIVKSQIGLNIPINILKSCLQEKRLNFLVEITHSKSPEEPTYFESNISDSEEPWKKKIKVENIE